MNTIINILENIGFDWKVALANLVNFLIIFWLLNKFIFSKIRVALENRKQTIEKSVEDAQKAETELMMAGEKKKEILDEARVEANLIFEDAHQKAKQTINQSVRDAELEAKKVMKDAQKKLEREKIDLEKQVERETVKMVIEGVEKALESEVNSDMQERITKRITA